MGKEVIDTTKSGEMGMGREDQFQSHSLWSSPVPYLFGGLAAMVCLIIVALLILACSFWNPLDSSERGDDVEANRKDGGEESIKAVYLEEFVVIMAGDTKPTFLATPISTTTCANVIATTKSEDDEHVVNKQDEEEEEEEAAETSEPPDAIN